jgi:Ribonuclease G/E
VTETIHVDSSPGEVRIAVERDGALIDYALWRPGAPDGVGDLHRGRVVGVVPAMAGVFVALDGAEGFLPDSEGGKGLTVGTVLGVRVIRAAQGHKGPRLTARLSEAEHRVIGTGSAALVRRGPDPLHRLAERYKRAEVLTADTALAAALRPALGARLRLSLDATLPDPVGAAVDALAEPVVALANGARLSIWPTPALVAIYID